MKYTVYFVFVLLFFTFCKSQSFEIIDEKNDGRRKLLWVKIPERVNEEGLEELGKELQDNYSSFDKFFIKVFIPDGDTIVFWSTIKIEDEIETNILGTTINEYSNLSNPYLDGIDTSKIIGKWIDNNTHVSKTVIYYKKNDTTYLRNIHKDGSFGDRLLKKEGNKYIVNEGEWHFIESNGNLGIYGVNGKYYEYKLIK